MNISSQNKYLAIICEFNPLHNGHKYLIDCAKRDFPDHKIVAIMSGQFTQRGDIAILNKYSRAKHAILAGIDIVVELPTLYALSSADNFALGGVRIANSIDGLEHIVFGSEDGNIDELSAIAKVLCENDDDVAKSIKSKNKTGVTYAKAIADSLRELYPSIFPDSNANANLLSKPNNILAVQYIKALMSTHSTITPHAYKRLGESYDSCHIDNESIASATGIRNLLANPNEQYERKLSLLNLNVPTYVAETLSNTQKVENFLSISERAINLCYFSFLSDSIFSSILTKTKTELFNIAGMDEGLENRILASAKATRSLPELLESIKTKRYTASRLRRALLCTLLNITKCDLEQLDLIPLYANILSIKKNSLSCLSDFHIPFLTKLADRQKLDSSYDRLLFADDKANALFCYYSKENIRHAFEIIN